MRIPALSASLLTASILSIVGGQTAASSQLAVKTVDTQFTLGEVSVTTKQQIVEPALTTEGTDTTAETKPVEQEPIVRPPVIATVVKGDTLTKLASAHQTTVQRLFDANPSITDPNLINPGNQIRIPYADEVVTSRPMPAPKPLQKTTETAKPTPKQTSRKITTTAPAVADGSVWDALARCESGGNWAINTGNGYYGGLQFLPSTWRAVGGQGLPHENSREEQILRGQILQARSGWGQWPACARKLGLL
jgi:LysM repeat protein